ncbi:hypothetical protein VTJ49DRAFT_3868 [Mycothermus thermophilus]|uniref:Thioesterase domain-containing protein n=1 Tax=Humicola insolens TaxID=85995 RepID=A0ABR3VQM9_HUMIN
MSSNSSKPSPGLWQPNPYANYPGPDHTAFLASAATATEEDESDPILAEANARATARQIAFFRSIPWCAALLDKPGLTIQQAESRRLNRTALDALCSRTLNQPGAIPAYVIFYDPNEGLSSSHTSSSSDDKPLPLITQVSSLVALGPLVNGWTGICHGGIIATLLDETLGQIFAANGRHGRLPGKKAAAVPVMTGYLNTKFVRPVRTGTVEAPRVILVTSRIVRHEGRKFFMKADVRDEKGAVLSEADALFVMLKEKL